MKWRTFPVLGLVAILIIVGVMVVIYLQTHTSATTISIACKGRTPSLSQQDRQSIETALKTQISNEKGNAGNAFTITSAMRQGDWAVFGSQESRTPGGQPLPTEGIFFIAHYKSGTWTVWMPSSPGFCDQVKQIPDALLAPVDKGYFC